MQQWLDWCDFLVKNRAEVIETMKEECLVRELCIIKGRYVFYAVFGKGNPATGRQINLLHKKNITECLEICEEITDFMNGLVVFDFIVRK